MAGELKADASPGANVYFQIRNASGQIWNTAASAFQAYAAGTIGDYDIPATEQGASGFFVADFPSAITSGIYDVIAKEQQGGSPSQSDPTVGTGTIEWTGIVIGQRSNIKKNHALADFPFLMTDSTNHGPATGKSVTVTRSIDGAAFAAGTLANVTEVGSGTYTVDFAAADLNGNSVVLRAVASGCDDTFERIITVP